MLLQLQRHSDHHANPSRPYTRLRSWPEAPQLPLGYSAMLPITFIPPLYRALIHPRLDAGKNPKKNINQSANRA